MDKKIAANPNRTPKTKFRSKVSVPNNTERMLVIAAEKGMIIATMLASTYFIALVRMVQHKAEQISVRRITAPMCKGWKENLICSMGICVPNSVGRVITWNKTVDAKDTTKLVKDWVARYNVVCNFFAYIPVPAMLNPYSKPESAHRISPIPHDVPVRVIPFKTNALIKQRKLAMIVVTFGFFFTKINIKIGTVMQENVSKNAYFAGVV